MADPPKDPKDEKVEDELAARRAEAEAAGETPDGQSLEDIEANGGATTTEPDGQDAFVFEHGRKVSFGTLIKRGTDVEYRVKFGGISKKGKGEPVPLEARDIVLAGRYLSGGLNFVPSHDDEGNVTKVIVYATLKPQGTPVEVNSPEGQLLVGKASILNAVAAMRDEGLSETAIRKEFKAALDETAA